ncbi:FAD-binding domain-containing protein [Halalkalicoccus jeotgali]|nr:FAD-binding domain-containing protein [Halalkalicoccus jeotgali]
MTVLFWHRTDLRLQDNRALEKALQTAHERGTVVQPIFVFDSQFYSEDTLACHARIRFLHQCLESLRDQYRTHGSELTFLYGEPIEQLLSITTRGFRSDSNATEQSEAIFYTRHPTARYGEHRDRRLHKQATDSGLSVQAVPEGAITFDADERGINSRDGWSERCENYLTGDPLNPNMDPLVGPDEALESEVTIDEIEDTYGIAPTKQTVPRGGHTAAHRRLNWFGRPTTIADYPEGISPPAKSERQTSRLSPYLRFGVLSPRQIYNRTVDQYGARRARELFESRLYWNRHFRQKLADNPTLTEQAVNPVFRGLYAGSDHRDEERITAWKEGRTGFPMVDASMRALTETGFLNFRMRAMVASFFSYILKQWWRIGADFMYYHLIDADPAINYAQWQMQCGLVGCHPNRIYNPRKQVRENDPAGEFIREYVPELQNLSTTFLERPEKTPLHVQEQSGVTIGDTSDAVYPYPIVDFEREATLAREQFNDRADAAREALQDPDVRRRASLSRKRRHQEFSTESTGTNSADTADQQQLADYS